MLFRTEALHLCSGRLAPVVDATSTLGFQLLLGDLFSASERNGFAGTVPLRADMLCACFLPDCGVCSPAHVAAAPLAARPASDGAEDAALAACSCLLPDCAVCAARYRQPAVALQQRRGGAAWDDLLRTDEDTLGMVPLVRRGKPPSGSAKAAIHNVDKALTAALSVDGWHGARYICASDAWQDVPAKGSS